MRASLSLLRFPLLAFLCLLLLSTTAACDRDDSVVDDDEHLRSSDEESLDDVAETDLVASGGAVELTLEEVERAVERMRLVMPRDPDGSMHDGEMDWFRSPPAQLNLVRNLVHFQIVRYEASRRDLEITDEEEIAFISEHENLRLYLPLFAGEDDEEASRIRAELDLYDLSIEDVRHLAHDMIYHEKLREVLGAEFSDERLWEFYASAHDEADLIVVRVHNSPTSQEVDQAMDTLDSEIRAHFRQNRDRYTTRPATRVIMLQPGPGVEADAIEEVLSRAVSRMGDGDDPEAVAADLGLVLRPDTHLFQAENPEAFEAAVGDAGYSLHTRRGPYALRVEEHLQGQRRSLDRPLRREIAAQLLRDRGILPSKLELATEARQLLASFESDEPLSQSEIDALVSQLNAEGFDVLHTGPFSVSGSGYIPQVGLAEELTAAVRELSLDDALTDPVLDRNRILLARLVDRHHADRDEFDENIDEFREQFLARNQGMLIDQFVANYQREHDIDLNLQIVARHFGTIHEKVDDVVASPQRPRQNPVPE